MNELGNIPLNHLLFRKNGKQSPENTIAMLPLSADTGFRTFQIHFKKPISSINIKTVLFSDLSRKRFFVSRMKNPQSDDSPSLTQ